jgi:hypothetical protein
VFLAGRRFDGSDDLPGNAKLRKRSEGGKLIASEIPDRFKKTNHSFLDNVFAVSTDQKVGPRLGTDKIPILVDQVLFGDCIPIFG